MLLLLIFICGAIFVSNDLGHMHPNELMEWGKNNILIIVLIFLALLYINR